MKLEREFDIKFESINYLEKQITSSIWDLLYENIYSIPKNTKVKLVLEFK